jgi:hypothetical protein
VTLKRGWPDGPDHVSDELRRALDEAAHRLPDDVSLRRIWATVAAPPEPPRTRRGFWFAGGVASAMALAVLAGIWVVPRAADLVQAVRTHTFANADGARRLTLEGGVEATIGRSGVMRIDDGAPRVEAGEVRFSVPHRRPGHPFVVRVQEYHVVVVGTRFGIALQDGGTMVDVDEGIVEVWDSQRRLARLTPGESWRSPQREAAAETPPHAAVPAPPPPAPPAAEPTFVVPSVIAHAHRVPTRRIGRTVALASPGPTEERDRPAASDPAAAARAALSAGDATRALQLYRALAQQGTGPEAENAAYEVGKVLNERMGQPASAVAAWRRYRAGYPDGILRVEADVSIIETLAKSGDSDGALAEATDFLRRRPDSERRAEIARLAGDLYRARGDCRHAVGMYQIAASATRPRDAVEAAAAHRAECQARLAGESAR